MESDSEANKFGKFLMSTMRDMAIDHFDQLAAGNMKAPSDADLQSKLAQFTSDQKDVARLATIAAIDYGLHAFLFALSEIADADEDGEEVETQVVITVDGENIAEQSDGLHGELFCEDGWLAMYSRHGGGG